MGAANSATGRLSITADEWRQIVDSAIDTAIITIDRAGKVTSWSAGAQHILGWREDEMLGRSLECLFPDDQGPSALGAEMANAMTHGRGGGEDGWRVRKGGSLVWGIGEMTPIRDADNDIVGFTKVLRDRSQHRRAEEALAEERRALSILNRAGSTLASETDLQKLVQIVTDAGVELTGAAFGAFFGVGDDDGASGLGLEGSSREETILVVEDDDDVRAYTVQCLRDLGYRVFEAHDGASAIRLLEHQAQEIDLLFTDVVMPGMSGRELADELHKGRPDLRVLYTSGYTRNAIVHGGRLDSGVEMIMKPFTFEALSQKVRDMLDTGRTGRVLIVQVEPTVRSLTAEALGSSGLCVEEAGTGAEALGKVRAAQGRYDAVLLDDLLPDWAGEDLARELRALHFQLPILITSQVRASDLEHQFADDRCVAIIAKPYTAGALQNTLRALGIACRGLHASTDG